jgi:small subunit ribosomal protein S1
MQGNIKMDIKEIDEMENTQSSDITFSQQLKAYTVEKPKKGQILQGVILRIDEDAVLMDIGAKCDAIVPRNDLDRLDDAVRENLSVGKEIPVYVLRIPIFGEKLLVSINRGLEQQDWDRAQDYLSRGELIELEVTGMNRGGVTVDFGRVQGFVPNSLIPELRAIPTHERNAQQEKLIGTRMLLKVIEVISRRKRLILSAMQAQEQQKEKRLHELEVGQVIKGRVVNIVDFGAFLDLGGVDGLLHISEYDHATNINHLADVIDPGEELEVKIIEIDVERARISLSRKALIPGPWAHIEEKYDVGDLVQGEVTNVVDFGAFVQIPEGVEGLVHKSEMENIPLAGFQEVVEPGQQILTKILNIDLERQRMSLSLSQVSYEELVAWEREKQIETTAIEGE